MSKPKVLVPVADGIEEIEAVSIIDILRRANIEVFVSSIGQKGISCANLTKLHADSLFGDNNNQDYDAIVLPGGTLGAQNFSEHEPLVKVLKDFKQKNKIIGAICASPALVLAKHGIIENQKATTYPALKEQIKNYQDAPVVKDGQLITGQGPAFAFDFAFCLVEALQGPGICQAVKKDMLFQK